MQRNRLYLILCIVLTVSYGWVTWSLLHTHNGHFNFTPCAFKYITGVPCPSCGITRAAIEIAKGHFSNALLINPLGFVAAGIMLVCPFWLLYDVTFKKNTLFKNYGRFENILKIKWVAIPLIILIFANWGWNIYKGL